MASDDSRLDSTDLKILESRIDELIATCRRPTNENQTPKPDPTQLT